MQAPAEPTRLAGGPVLAALERAALDGNARREPAGERGTGTDSHRGMVYPRGGAAVKRAGGLTREC